MELQFNERVLAVSAYPTAELNARKKKLKEAGTKIYDFGTGDPIEPTPEFIREALSASVPKISQYPTVKGTLELRTAIAGYNQRRFGVTLDPETEILPVTGSKEAIYNINCLLVGPGCTRNTIINGTPTYPIPDRGALLAGADLYTYQLKENEEYLLDLETVAPAVLNRTAIVWLNYPHNPTGAEATLEYYEKQVAVAKKHGIVICSDECYVDLYFGEKLPPSVLQVSKTGVLAFNSCSKRSGMTAYRTGFMAGDARILKVFAGFRDNLGVATPVYTQAAAAKAWSDDQHTVERRKAFQAKREVFLKFFAENKLSYTKTSAGLYFWIKTPRGESGKDYAFKLMERGIIVGPGEFYGSGCEHYFRMALVPTVEDCSKALELWKEIL